MEERRGDKYCVPLIEGIGLFKEAGGSATFSKADSLGKTVGQLVKAEVKLVFGGG